MRMHPTRLWFRRKAAAALAKAAMGALTLV